MELHLLDAHPTAYGEYWNIQLFPT
jgi:hypothetical protein